MSPNDDQLIATHTNIMHRQLVPLQPADARLRVLGEIPPCMKYYKQLKLIYSAALTVKSVSAGGRSGRSMTSRLTGQHNRIACTAARNLLKF